MSEVMTEPRVPDPIILPERFKLDREIGRGGMAVVYRAHDRHLDREVAIKVLSEELSTSVGIERFQREIALMAKLVHPGIVALFDSGEVDGRLFYVMPFVAGDTLRARLLREKRMTMEDASAYAADIADALAYAHGLGIVHRDVKPENVFAVGGRAVLADFGIARIVERGETAMDLTGAGMIVGTTTYMSPEQASGGELDGRSDLYSLGCVLYELLSGAPPFVAPNAFAVLARHLTEAPRPVSEHEVRISPAMEALIMQLLEKNPASRPPNAASVARQLRAAPSGESQIAGRATQRAAETNVDGLLTKGIEAWRRGIQGGAATRHTLDEARAYLERALAIEPNNARALCAMSNWHSVMAVRGFTDDRAASMAKSRELIFAALAADDRCAEVHSSLGVLALYFDDDFHAAARHFQQALELEPNDPEALRFQSVVYKILGRIDEAVDFALAAVRRAPDAASIWNGLGDVLIASGRNAEAVDTLKRAISILPGYGPALERLELAQFRSGDLDHALETRASRLRIAGRGDRAALLVREAGTLGYVEARRLDVARELDEMLKEAEHGDPFGEWSNSRSDVDKIVIAYAELGEWHKAMDWIERAYERRPGRLRRMLTDHPFDRRGLAVDPRYARLLRVAGMEELL